MTDEPMDLELVDALCASIQRYGQLLPVLVDTAGNLVDGRHRIAACERLGVTVKREVVKGDAVELGAQANYVRRVIPPEVRYAELVRLTELGYSLRAVAKVVDLPRETVRRRLSGIRPSGSQGGRTKGVDGRVSGRDWAAIQAEHDAGASYEDLAEREGLKVASLTRALEKYRRAVREGRADPPPLHETELRRPIRPDKRRRIQHDRALRRLCELLGNADAGVASVDLTKVTPETVAYCLPLLEAAHRTITKLRTQLHELNGGNAHAI